jgi:hypothetical protein
MTEVNRSTHFVHKTTRNRSDGRDEVKARCIVRGLNNRDAWRVLLMEASAYLGACGHKLPKVEKKILISCFYDSRDVSVISTQRFSLTSTTARQRRRK